VALDALDDDAGLATNRPTATQQNMEGMDGEATKEREEIVTTSEDRNRPASGSDVARQY